MPRKLTTSFLVPSILLILASCDVGDKIASADSVQSQIAPGQRVIGSLPGVALGESKSKYSFQADSGKTYTLSWNDSGRSVDVGVVSAAGEGQYVEIAGPDSGFERSVVFPALKSGAYAVLVTGLANCRYELELMVADGLPAWVALPDRWENDDFRSAASVLPLDSSWQFHSLATSGKPDIDWMRFDVDSGWTYSVARQDSLVVGVVGGLYDADSQYLGADGYAATRKGRIYYRVVAPTGKGGFYRIRALASKGFPQAFQALDAYENDDNLHSAKSISTDSIWQDRTVHLEANGNPNPDFIRFHADSGYTYKVYAVPTVKRYMKYLIEILGSDSLPSLYALDTSSSERLLVNVPCVRSGDYFASVDSRTGALAYRIAVAKSAGLPAWAVPDRDRNDTGLVPTDSSAYSRTILASDTEWVKFRVAKGTAYRIRLQNKHPSEQPVALTEIVMDAKLRLVKQAVVASAITVEMVVQPDWDGFCYIRLAASIAGNSGPIAHELRVNEIVGGSDPLEPDDSPDQASFLPADGKTITRWYSRSDTDWMKIQVDSGRPINIGVRQLETTIYNVELDLFSEDLLWIKTVTFFGTQGAELDYLPNRSGILYLHVTSFDEARHSYSIVNRPASNPNRSCDSIARGCVFVPDSSNTSLVIPPGAVEWFSMAVDSGRTYEVDLQSDLQASINLFGADRKILANYPSYTDLRRYYYQAKATGIVYLSMGQMLGSAVDCHLSMRVSALGGLQGAAGSVLSGARTIDADSSAFEGILYSNDKKALFRFQAEAGTTYLFAANSDYATGLAILSTDSVVQMSGWSDLKTKASMSFSPVRSGAYYLELDNGWSQINRWRLMSRRYLRDGFENDDSMAVAGGLPSDGTVQRRNSAGSDIDWMSVDVDSGTVYELGMKTDRYLDVRLFSEDSLLMGDSLAVGPATSNPVRRFTARRRTKVFVRVVGLDPYGISVTEYQIWADKSKVVTP